MTDVFCIACGIFREELRLLGPRFPGLKPVYLDSMLHMRPAALQERIDGLLAGQDRKKVLFVYGDCTPRIVELCRRPGYAKTAGINCCEILLGRDEYRRLRRAGAFFFLPEWTGRWRDVFERELGFAGGRGVEEMLREVHDHFLYLDTGVAPVPEDTLKEISMNLGLSMSVLPVGLSRFEENINTALETLHVRRE
jgi:hypothetical protein